jgi:hypothetical protein
MGAGSVLWAEIPDEDRNEAEETEAHGAVDESFSARRLRRWLGGMFGGTTADEPEPAAKRPVRDSGPVEGDRGNREAPPTHNSEL